MAPHSTESTDWQVNYPEIKMRSAHLWRSRDWIDCTFRFESPETDVVPQGVEATVEAHKLILAMASPVFAAMFYGDVGDKEGTVLISDIDLEIFKKMMVYIYTDEVDITNAEVAIDLYRAANKYILVHLEKKCIDYLFEKLNTNNVCHVYEFSCLYNIDELKQKCLEMFSTSTRDVLKGYSFNNAQIETLKTIYSMDSLKIDSELELIDALVLYTEAQSQEVKKYTDVFKMDQKETLLETKNLNTNDCSSDVDKAAAEKRKGVATALGEVRFLTLAPDEFAECKNLRQLLSESEICSLSMNISSAKTFVPMPAGFSTSRMPRNKGKKNSVTWTERITIKNMAKLKKYQSRIFCVGNIPWMVELTSFFKKNEKQLIEKRLLVDIICLLDLKLTWNLNTLLGVRVLPCNANVYNMTETTRSAVTVVSSENDGTQTSFSWKMLTDPSLGVIRDDGSLILEVYIAQGNLAISRDQTPEKREDEPDYTQFVKEIEYQIRKD